MNAPVSNTAAGIPQQQPKTERADQRTERTREHEVRPRGRSRGLEQITAAADRLNQRLVETTIHFTAQAVDMHLDDVRDAFPIGFPQVLAEHLAA